jgi:hypothetical protein
LVTIVPVARIAVIAPAYPEFPPAMKRSHNAPGIVERPVSARAGKQKYLQAAAPRVCAKKLAR